MPAIQEYMKSSLWRNISTVHLDRFFIDVLKSDERTKNHFSDEITIGANQKTQLKADVSSITGLALGILTGIGWTSKTIAVTGALFKDSPIELGFFANHESHMKGGWLFRIPFDRDRLNVNGKELTIDELCIWVSSSRKGLFDSSLTEVKTVCAKEAAQPYRSKIPGIMSISSDEELKNGIFAFFQKARSLMYGEYIGRVQFEIEYQRSGNSTLGLLGFGFKNSPTDWKDELKRGLSPDDLIVSLFCICNRIIFHLKEDFQRVQS